MSALARARVSGPSFSAFPSLRSGGGHRRIRPGTLLACVFLVGTGCMDREHTSNAAVDPNGDPVGRCAVVLRPTTYCVTRFVTPMQPTRWVAFFGYEHTSGPAVRLSPGPRNRSTPAHAPGDGRYEPPTVFVPGQYPVLVAIEFDGTEASWTLGKDRATASSRTPICWKVEAAQRFRDAAPEPSTPPVRPDASSSPDALAPLDIGVIGEGPGIPAEETLDRFPPFTKNLPELPWDLRGLCNAPTFN